MNCKVLVLSLAVLGAAFVQAQAPWPQEGQDRWGTRRQPVGPDPAAYTAPWVFKALQNGIVSSAPTLDSDGTGYYGTWVSNQVYKFNWQTGATLGAFTATGFCTSSPVIGPAPYVYPDAGGKLLAINRGTMDFDWFFNTGGNDGSDWDHASAVVGPDGYVVFGGNSGVLYKFNPISGATAWSRPGLGNMFHTPCFSRDDTKVYVSNGNHMTAINYSDGTIAWSVDYGNLVGGPGIAPDGTVVYGSDNGTIYFVNPDTGATIGNFTALASVRAAPAFDSAGNAYVCSYDQRMYSLRTIDGVRNWSFTSVGGTAMTSPLCGPDGRIYFENRAGNLYCVSSSGAQIWQVHLNGEPRGSMSLAPDGTLFANFVSGASGLAMIRQTGYDLPIETISAERGSLISGGLPQIAAVDGNYLIYQTGLTLNATEQPVRIVFTAHTPYKPLSQFTIKLNTRASTPGLEQRVEMFNYTTGQYETVDTRSAPLTDTNLTLAINSNAARFARSSDGEMKLRVGYRAVGITTQSNWVARFDYVSFGGVTPTFQAP